MKALKAFIKPFEAPQRRVKQKFNLIFISMQLSEMHRTLRVNRICANELTSIPAGIIQKNGFRFSDNFRGNRS